MRLVLPVVDGAAGDLDGVPAGVRLLDALVELGVLLGLDGRVDGVEDLLLRRPDVLEVDIVAVAVLPNGVVLEVDVDRAREGVRDDERRAREVVGLDERVDAALEVAVAAEHARDDQVALGDRRGHRLGQRARVADARRAAVADEVEAEPVEVVLQARLLEVGRDHAGARREARLDVGLDLQALLDGLLRQKPRAQHHARVGGVRAARDGRNRDIAVPKVQFVALVVLVPPGAGQRLWREPEPLRRGGTRERLPELALHVAERDAVLRALRPGHGRLHVAEVEFEDRRELGLRHVVRAEEALRLGVLLDQVDGLWRAVGARQEVERLLVDGEEAHGRAVLGRHVGDGRAVGEAHRGEAGAEELHELADDAVLAQHLRDRQREVRRRHALLELAGQAEADDLGHQHVDRLAQHGRLGLDPADAPAQHAQAVDHRRVAVGPDQRVGVGDGQAVVSGRGPHTLRDVLQVDLVADPALRRHDAEVLERVGAPAEELVALGVAVELDVGVDLERLREREGIDLHGVVDHEIDGHARVDLLGVAAVAGHRAAERGEVDHGRDAGEVLQEHAGGRVRDLDVGGVGRVVAREVADVVLADGPRHGGLAQRVLQEHLDREREPVDAGVLAAQGVEAEDGDGAARGLEGVACAEGVGGHVRRGVGN